MKLIKQDNENQLIVLIDLYGLSNEGVSKVNEAPFFIFSF